MTVSLIGDGIFLVAMAWQAYELWNAPAALALLGIGMTIPTIVFLLPAGVLSDRFDRRSIMLLPPTGRAPRLSPRSRLSLCATPLRSGSSCSSWLSTERPVPSSCRLSRQSFPTSFRKSTSLPPTRSISSFGRSRFVSWGPRRRLARRGSRNRRRVRPRRRHRSSSRPSHSCSCALLPTPGLSTSSRP